MLATRCKLMRELFYCTHAQRYSLEYQSFEKPKGVPLDKNSDLIFYFQLFIFAIYREPALYHRVFSLFLSRNI